MKTPFVSTAAALALSAGAVGLAQPASADRVGSMPKSQHVFLHRGESAGYHVDRLCGVGPRGKVPPVPTTSAVVGPVSAKKSRSNIRFSVEPDAARGDYEFSYTTCRGGVSGTHLVVVTVRAKAAH